jgi:hypothetical protein
MILFGGDNGTASSVASISILDVSSMKWTNGNNAPDARSEMACSVSGDNFIVWGGRYLHFFISYGMDLLFLFNSASKNGVEHNY